jgi:hypothetical protein
MSNLVTTRERAVGLRAGGNGRDATSQRRVPSPPRLDQTPRARPAGAFAFRRVVARAGMAVPPGPGVAPAQDP